MTQATITTIVENDLCIGCGVCAAICPDSSLRMEFNVFGEYIPVTHEKCKKECGLCLKVCPFSDTTLNEDEIGKNIFGSIEGISHHTETGYYLESFVGYSNVDGHRDRGASGGLGTWLLETLLRTNAVDAVICVTATHESGRLFRFSVLKNSKEIRESSGSVYYPVELSEIIRYILNNDGRYAIIGIPCFVKAIRLAQHTRRDLKDRIAFIAGLTCGQMKNKEYTAYLSACAGLKSNPVTINYRGKDPHQPANNYYFSGTTEDGDEGRLYLREGISEVWGNRWFTPNACNYCDDIYAECADIAFMDAWLPDYVKNPQGTNLIIVRSIELLTILNEARLSKQVDIQKTDISNILKSQAGVIDIKRSQLAIRLFLARQTGQMIPKKRVIPKNTLNIFNIWKIQAQQKMQKKSKFLSSSIKEDPTALKLIRKSMRMDLMIVKICTYIGYPKQILMRLLRFS